MTDIKYHSSAKNKPTCIMKFVCFQSFVRCPQSFSQNLLDVVPTAYVQRVYLLHMKVKGKGEDHPRTGNAGPEGGLSMPHPSHF
jgi:hypothetical protein